MERGGSEAEVKEAVSRAGQARQVEGAMAI